MTDRPQELRPYGHVLDNQRPSLAERSKKKVSAQQRREGNSAAHLAAIRALPCCVCLKVGCDPHHLKHGLAGEGRSFGRRAVDKFTVPLCRLHHDEIEAAGSRREAATFKAWGIADPIGMSVALYDAPRNPAAMTKIVLAHRS